MNALNDIHQCCAKGFYEIHTTYQCPSLYFHPPYFLMVGTGCPFLVLCFVGQGFPGLAFALGAQVQSLTCSSIEISPRF